MSASDLHDLSEALGIEPGRLAVAVAVVRRAVRDEVRAEVREAMGARGEGAAPSMLTIAEVVERLPWGRSKVDQMRKEGRIPLLMIGGRWVISEDQLARVQAAGFPLPGGRVATRRPARSA